MNIHPAARKIAASHSGQVKYSICTLVTNPGEYNEMLDSFIAAGFTAGDCEYLCIDNSGGNTLDAFAGGNLFLDTAQGRYVILCHQDLLLKYDDRAVLDRRLAELDQLDADWALAGNAGGTGAESWAARLTDPSGDQNTGSFPVKAQSLDEDFIVVKNEANLGLSHDLQGFHFYGTDLCQIARILGWNAWVIDFRLYHKSAGKFDESFYQMSRRMTEKYERALRGGLVQTMGIKLHLSGSGARNWWWTPSRRQLIFEQIRAERRRHKKGLPARKAPEFLDKPLESGWMAYYWLVHKIRAPFENLVRSAPPAAKVDPLSSPKISVLVPTYNYARFLPEAIESVLAQEFRDFELLIVDDCSADDTAAAVRPFCERDPRVHFSVNPANLGMVNNWNHCLELARGEYIKFLFGDDRLCAPDALGKMLALLEKNPQAMLAASARVIFDDRSRAIDVYRDLADGCHDGQEIIRACLMRNGKNLVGEPSAVLFRKADAKRGFDPRYRQIVDVEMWFHLLEKGALAYTREPLCAFRCHPLQQTERNTSAGIAWTEHARFIASHAVEPRYPREVVLPILFHLRLWQGRNPDAGSPEFLQWQERLAARLGNHWRRHFWLYCLRYRLAKPFRNLAHSLQKRLFRRQFKSHCAGTSTLESSVRSGSNTAGAKPV